MDSYEASIVPLPRHPGKGQNIRANCFGPKLVCYLEFMFLLRTNDVIKTLTGENQ